MEELYYWPKKQQNIGLEDADWVKSLDRKCCSNYIGFIMSGCQQVEHLPCRTENKLREREITQKCTYPQPCAFTCMTILQETNIDALYINYFFINTFIQQGWLIHLLPVFFYHHNAHGAESDVTTANWSIMHYKSSLMHYNAPLMLLTLKSSLMLLALHSIMHCTISWIIVNNS